ncbi:lysyl-tRNA synthetase [Byssothecium circinans]|uniref:Lysine--tRNA ligase n=1 Tax=Byssothecium circinans TaxID=147558 RepID=A0A6A5TPF9_9PLEO|nr:lysyl-tRNA synthetase [Byssothecium circinans]
MSRISLPFLRPYLFRSVNPRNSPEAARAYNAVHKQFIYHDLPARYLGPLPVEKQMRLDTLRNARPLGSYHPRLEMKAEDTQDLSIRDFISQYEKIQETQAEMVSVFGRVRSVRSLGSKLIFIDVERAGQRLQIMVEQKNLPEKWRVENFKELKKVVRIGDWVSFTGHPHRTKSGELSVLAMRVPQILAPCLHHIPEKVENLETLARHPHVHQLTSEEPGDILRLRALIYDHIRSLLVQDGFLEVETPMFDVRAGGAIARPFETVANELSNMPIRLRIAPELNLKRLIVGGQDRIFELGRAFRNEGVDNTHNPEFSTCEFYEVGATLPELIQRTENMVRGLHTAVESLRSSYFPSLAKTEGIDFSTPFKQLRFIPTIEEASGHQMPNLASPTATDDVLAMFKDLDIAVPPNPTLPRLLDTLAEKYIEPLCINPTFIINHPEALSPLSKTYHDIYSDGQLVAARAELFINGREYANTYEEENSPFEQRRKFIEQLEYHPEGEREKEIDESYLEVLEWGMPPTGGWGCGLDRLVMLFANKKRIADVLPFGTLRNVVSISKNK